MSEMTTLNEAMENVASMIYLWKRGHNLRMGPQDATRRLSRLDDALFELSLLIPNEYLSPAAPLPETGVYAHAVKVWHEGHAAMARNTHRETTP